MRRKKPEPEDKFNIKDLSWYFDTIAKDRLDSHSAGQRNAEWLDLRDQMMRLTDQEFTILMRSFRAAVKDVVGDRGGRNDASESQSSRQAVDLYNEVRGGGAQVAPKISAVS